VALRRTSRGTYEWDEVNVSQSAVWSDTPENLAKVSNVCGLQNWAPPTGSVIDRCPALQQLSPCTTYTTTGEGGAAAMTGSGLYVVVNVVISMAVILAGAL
jgi:hypothetical protein